MPPERRRTLQMTAQRSRAEVKKLAARAAILGAEICFWLRQNYGENEDYWPECPGKEAFRRLTDAAAVLTSNVSNETKYNVLRDAIRFVEAGHVNS